MKSIQQSIVIKGSVDDVFSALADPTIQMKFDGEMMRSCQKLTNGPIGMGTRFRGNFKGMGNIEYEYSEYQQNSLIEHAVNMPFGSGRHRFEFVKDGNGTRLTQTMKVELNIIGEIMWPIIIKGMMTKRMQTLNALLKQYIEQGR
jgi:uncharacterized protein YndB with AHSA1/START domain